ncbi:hypothetical protein MRO55_24520, partial [Escherichia coli]|uniref:RNA polymerase sigma factor region1.1 domain-containing protein n=1 Tax=Escherichia coli TaxID=562 RepID=UPI00211400E0
MNVADLMETDEARGLLDVAAQSGGISTEDIAAAFDDLDVEATVLDDFYAALDELHIEILGRAVVADEVEDDLDDERREISTDALQ